jgi:alpha-L-fucosidase
MNQAISQIENIIKSGPFAADSQSLQGYRVPRWYQDAKFGIFIHWGVYAVPGFGSEWYPRNMYQQGSPEFNQHVEVWGPQHKFGYKDFIQRFTAEHFNPQEWAELFRQAGAKYVLPVAEHHDGFSMYDSQFSRWTATKMGPKRDVIGQLAQSVRDVGMVFGLSNHRAENWWFFNGGRKFDSDVRDDQYRDLYGPAAPQELQPDEPFLNEWLCRNCELVDKYRPQIVWFDVWIEQPAFAPYLRRFAAYYYNRMAEWGLAAAINYKFRAYPEGAGVFDIERGQLKGVAPMLWQNDTAVSKNSWGYIKGQDYKSSTSIIHDLIDIVSKNGCLLLNIGPRPDGTIPLPEQQILRDIGQWLSVNGEAIYGTRPWRIFGSGPTEVPEGEFTDTKRKSFTPQDIRFTTSGDTIYVIALGWPEDRRLTTAALSTNSVLLDRPIKTVELLGSTDSVKWTCHGGALNAELPEKRPYDHAITLKITLASK